MQRRAPIALPGDERALLDVAAATSQRALSERSARRSRACLALCALVACALVVVLAATTFAFAARGNRHNGGAAALVVGACCSADGACANVTSAAACADAASTFVDGALCVADACPAPPSAECQCSPGSTLFIVFDASVAPEIGNNCPGTQPAYVIRDARRGRACAPLTLRVVATLRTETSVAQLQNTTLVLPQGGEVRQRLSFSELEPNSESLMSLVLGSDECFEQGVLLIGIPIVLGDFAVCLGSCTLGDSAACWQSVERSDCDLLASAMQVPVQRFVPRGVCASQPVPSGPQTYCLQREFSQAVVGCSDTTPRALEQALVASSVPPTLVDRATCSTSGACVATSRELGRCVFASNECVVTTRVACTEPGTFAGACTTCLSSTPTAPCSSSEGACYRVDAPCTVVDDSECRQTGVFTAGVLECPPRTTACCVRGLNLGDEGPSPVATCFEHATAAQCAALAAEAARALDNVSSVYAQRNLLPCASLADDECAAPPPPTPQCYTVRDADNENNACTATYNEALQLLDSTRSIYLAPQAGECIAAFGVCGVPP